MNLFIKRNNTLGKNIAEKSALSQYFLKALVCLPFTLLFSLPWTYVFLSNLSVDFNLTTQLLLQILIYVAAVVLLIKPLIPLIAFIGFGLASLGSFFIKLPWLQGLNSTLITLFDSLKEGALWTFATTQEGHVMPAAYPSYVGILAVLIGISHVWRHQLPFSLAFFLLLPFLGASDASAMNPNYVIALLITLIPLIYLFTRSDSRLNKEQLRPQIPLTIIVLLLSFLLQMAVPDNFFQNKELADQFRQIRKRLQAPEIVNYYEFSLRDAGYYPLNQDLGGPMELNHEIFMGLNGPKQPIRLRGAVSEEFSGTSWLGEEMEPNYIFDNESTHGVQAEVFSYPSALASGQSLTESLYYTGKVEITPIRKPIQVVFNGGRPQSITEASNPDQIYYFNLGGQIYAGVEITNPYLVEGWFPQELNNKKKYEILSQALNKGDIVLSEIDSQAMYKDVLKKYDTDLYHIVYGKEKRSPSEKLAALRDLIAHLQQNYEYTLDVAYPSAEQDFLESFLNLKEGYCTYFATALTLFAREIGVQARYVEGFLVPALNDADLTVTQMGADMYYREVLSDSAHSWVEVNFKNLGWYPFDATPANVLAGFTNQNDSENQEREREKESESEEQTTPPRQETTTTKPQESQTKPEESSKENQVTPPPPQNQQMKVPPRPLSPMVKILLIVLGIILLIALIFYLIWHRGKRMFTERHDPRVLNTAIHKYGQRTILEKIWLDLRHIYSLAGDDFPDNKTLQQKYRLLEERFALDTDNLGYQSYLKMEEVFFGEVEIESEDLMLIFDFYRTVEDALRLAQEHKSSWFWKRLLLPPRSAQYKNT